jgi:hypothetical protein
MERATLDRGLIVANYGRHFLVETPEGKRLICHSRGKKSQGLVGDRVLWQASQDEGTIEKIEERRNVFYRQDEIRTKSFAANLDQKVIWSSPLRAPGRGSGLTGKCITACCRCRSSNQVMSIAQNCSSCCTAKRRWCWGRRARAKAP